VAITVLFQANSFILANRRWACLFQDHLDFAWINKLQGRHFIDHNIVHVYPVADRIVVLDRGTVAGQFMKGELTFDDLIDRLTRLARTGSLESNPHTA
jgi:ABC-type sugar transport system ATPase subunit